ncbi:tyrosine-type recombinase/integrase [Pseudovibrio sp. WM33]|uniref:tyrosine-type recombinase/integrase n=1 Tax=Pseudovibrio sp. WM33 TaxID=1735585 RepID=UPI0007AE97C6|nr:tyrosine-type recombinase/integrase [Pseudovibrio sp. WM33]KZL25880.1 Tyrosine recombinase XerD [Pseudovibrio sp. WM33]
MGYIERSANQIADVLMREGLDYIQTKSVFKLARAKAGLVAPKEKRGSPARLTLEEELRFIDQAYVCGGQTGLMMQVLLETGTRASEFTALCVEDISLVERLVTITHGKGGRRREIPIRPETARLLALHIGKRRAGPLFVSRQSRQDGSAPIYTRQRIGQIVREVAKKAGITKRLYPHLLRHTMATRLLALGMDIADVQKFLGHEDLSSTRIYAETSLAMLKRKFDQVTQPQGRALIGSITAIHGDVVGAFAADLLSGDRRALT